MKKRIFTLALATLMLLTAILPASAVEYANTAYVIIEPQYDEVGSMSDGFAAVRVGDKWGYIDQTGAMVVEPSYDWAGRVSEGVALVAKYEPVIDEFSWDGYEAYLLHLPSGVATPLTYYEWRFAANLPVASRTLDVFEEAALDDGILRVGAHAFRADGTEITTVNFDAIKYFDHELGDYNDLSFDDEIVFRWPVDGIIPRYTSAVWYGEPVFYLTDTAGNILRTFINAEDTDATNTERLEFAKGIIDLCAPNEGLTMVRYGGRVKETVDAWGGPLVGYWGVLDEAGNYVIPPIYTDFMWRNGRYLHDGMISLKDQNGKWGAIDRTGAVRVPFIYDSIGVFSGGYTLVTLGNDKFYIDKNNNRYAIAGVTSLGDATSFNDAGYAILDDQNGVCHVIQNDPAGGYFPELRLPQGYKIADLAGNSLVLERDGKYGFALIVDQRPASGTPIGDVEYTNIVAYIDGKPIRSYNINDNTHIVIEDLINYGFAFVWDGAGTGRAIITGERTFGPDQYVPTYTPDPNAPTTGIATYHLATNVTTWLGDTRVKGYNIGGQTCIWLDDLARVFDYGIVWDGANAALRLTTTP